MKVLLLYTENMWKILMFIYLQKGKHKYKQMEKK